MATPRWGAIASIGHWSTSPVRCNRFYLFVYWFINVPYHWKVSQVFQIFGLLNGNLISCSQLTIGYSRLCFYTHFTFLLEWLNPIAWVNMLCRCGNSCVILVTIVLYFRMQSANQDIFFFLVPLTWTANIL